MFNKNVKISEKTHKLLKKFKAKFGPALGFIIEEAVRSYVANEMKKLEEK